MINQEQTKLKVTVRKEILEIKDQIIDIRRHLHQYPETAYQEIETSKFIKNFLSNLGFQVFSEVGQTGVVGILKGDISDQPCIMLRADMDGLNQQELSDESFISKIPGKHHGCGHDGHMAMLLGCAKIVSQWKSKIKGTIKFCFQPAEEGGFGAKAMVQDTKYPVLENPKVSKCFGMHLANFYQYPQVIIKEGLFSANSDRFYVTVEGVGGHPSTPHLTVDSIVIACQLVVSIQTIISRNVNPINQATICIGKIEGGSAPNIISNSCSFQGTTRTMNEEDREIIIKRLDEICKGFELSYNCKVNLLYKRGYDCIFNHKQEVEDIKKASQNLISSITNEDFGLAGEDFFYYSQNVPSAYLLLGSAPEGTVSENRKFVKYPLHSPQFKINEECLLLGTSIWIQLVENLLVLQQ